MASSYPSTFSLAPADAPKSAAAPWSTRALSRLSGAVDSTTALRTPIDRPKVRLVAGLSLINVVVFVAAAIAVQCEAGFAGDRIVVAAFASAALGMLAAYFLARRAKVSAAAHLSVAVQLAVPALLMLFGVHLPGFDAFENVVWLTVALFFANALTTPRTTGAVVVIALGTSSIAFALAPSDQSDEFIRGWFFFVICSALVVSFGIYRDRVESARAAELRNRNEELETLRRSLEERVAERTAALRASHNDLADAYDTLQQNQQSMLVAEKMASLGRFTAGIAHEMNSPLSAVRAALSDAKQLAEEYSASIADVTVLEADHRAIALEIWDAVSLADAGAERVSSFVRSIRAQTRSVGDRPSVRFEAVAAVKDAMQLVSHAAVASGVRVDIRIEEKTAYLVGDPGRLAQVVTNLVGNAIDATSERGPHGSVVISLEPDEDHLLLRVVDDGTGIDESNLAKIFDPLFTTKPVGKGTGLGLTIVHEIVTGTFAGTVHAYNRPEGGAAFDVRLPRAKKES